MGSSETDSDAVLMMSAKRGDLSAFETLVAKYQKPLLNFFVRLGVTTDAEDLVQQTFLRLYRYRERYEPSAKFTTFLYLMARQVRIDEVRRRLRFTRLCNAAKEQTEIEMSAASRPTPALRDDLQKALAKLSDGAREVVVMGVLQEMPYEEIGAILHIPVGTVKSRMFNALRKLKKIMEKE